MYRMLLMLRDTTHVADPSVVDFFEKPKTLWSDTLSIKFFFVRRCLFLTKKVFIQILFFFFRISFSIPFWSNRIGSRKCSPFQLPEFEMFFANNYSLVVDQSGAIWHGLYTQ